MLPADLTNADAQPDSPERRAQIDDFMRLLEDARRAAEAGEQFALALLAPAARLGDSGDNARSVEDAADGSDQTVEAGGSDHPSGADDNARDSDRLGGAGDDAEAAKSAHEFLRLNLRRADSLAFYGPTLLVALLPRRHPRRAREDLARLLDELRDERPRVRLACGLASFPADGADVETLIDRADARLNAVLARDGGADDAVAGTDSDDGDDAAAAESLRVRFQFDGADSQTSSTHAAPTSATHERLAAQEFPPGARSDPVSSGEWRASASARHAASERGAAFEQSQARRGLPSHFAARRAVRESRRGDEFEAAVLSYAPAAGASGSVLGSAAAEAAARERERRAAGERMPRRVLLTVSNPALMAQINLLLRSAAYEVRAAFDGGQALDLLRIERADLLVLDYELKVLDAPAVLRRLHERHRGRLPMPVALLLPPERDTEQLREEARGFGATGFVPLPYDPAALLECVRTTGSAE